MTQSLYLLRHAKSQPWTPGCDDFSRRLNDRGQSHARDLSLWMRDHLEQPDLVLCSGSVRTRETLAPILEAWPGLAQATQYTDDIYEATTGSLHGLAAAGFERADRLLMVGHNPGFENLATAVLTGEDANRITKMPTGTLAVIAFAESYDEDAGEGSLVHWVTRKSLSD
ncbi:MAG: histidine phosphatase family protein [Xanthomonadales bacterium]|nr:histidine phosphatase family protein [Xanthomonadales bacterium]